MHSFRRNICCSLNDNKNETPQKYDKRRLLISLSKKSVVSVARKSAAFVKRRQYAQFARLIRFRDDAHFGHECLAHNTKPNTMDRSAAFVIFYIIFSSSSSISPWLLTALSAFKRNVRLLLTIFNFVFFVVIFAVHPYAHVAQRSHGMPNVTIVKFNLCFSDFYFFFLSSVYTPHAMKTTNEIFSVLLSFLSFSLVVFSSR